jgi:hypothetical protein
MGEMGMGNRCSIFFFEGRVGGALGNEQQVVSLIFMDPCIVDDSAGHHMGI